MMKQNETEQSAEDRSAETERVATVIPLKPGELSKFRQRNQAMIANRQRIGELVEGLVEAFGLAAVNKKLQKEDASECVRLAEAEGITGQIAASLDLQAGSVTVTYQK